VAVFYEEEEMSDAERLQVEFEFVQNLANPTYLHFLAQNKYFENENFINFLTYLQYWKRPEYCKFLVFPQCLSFLDALINNSDFREKLAHQNFRNFVHQQQAAHWLQSSSTLSNDTTPLDEPKSLDS